MSGYSRDELEVAFANYCEINDRASAEKDWSAWASKFTEDAIYVEHAYGTFHGRDALQDWIERVMAPFPQMDFPMDWHITDPERGWIVFQCQNRLQHPTDPSQPPFEFPSWSLIKYAGNHLWRYEEDNYNPNESREVIIAWLKAGGEFAAPVSVKMK